MKQSKPTATDCIQCRHHLDPAKIEKLSALLRNLPEVSPDLLSKHGIQPEDFDLYFRSSIESIRGTYSATGLEKRRFFATILDEMKNKGQVKSWEFVGTQGQQDYKLVLSNGRVVCIEAKGCPDGNNMTIWERPSWAEEFIVWSQCPDSLQHNPGHGVWSGIATRLLPKVIIEGKLVDAFVFFDGRCGTPMRPCPKKYGITGDLRKTATDIKGNDGAGWLPPPSIYLFPRTTPHPHTNRKPPLHDLTSCTFADSLLAAFNVPKVERNDYLNWASVEVKGDSKGTHMKVDIGFGLNNSTPVLAGEFKRLRRE
jgi:hypothetical protein